ncbi:MAG: cation-binding protein [Rhizobiales bacterium]|nr:cation-binding protein [Hyphomicrobiales bacterium]|tara:strand:+ start:203 stop:793 length:591 start_codon:yes stop_codon:yes gene_type:complete
MNSTPDPLSLAGRTGLPEDLRILVSQYPRETWQTHENLGEMAQFWLQRHDMFREMGKILTGAIGDWREGRTDDREFAGFFVPRLNWYLGNLDGHHNIEDHHYFPVFRKAESRLERGFDILDKDHHVIHDALEMNADAARKFLEALDQGGDPLKRAGEAYATENERLMGFLTRHLADEEDLIIPVILDQGERKLGVT